MVAGEDKLLIQPRVAADRVIDLRTRRPRGLVVYCAIAVAMTLVYTVYQEMRAGPRSLYPYEGMPWHAVLVTFDSGVGWFFLVSGYSAAVPYARTMFGITTIAPDRVIVFRWIVRFLPLYAISILIVWSLRNRSFPGDWRDLLEHLTFTQVFDRKRIFFTIGPAWALAVQAQFLAIFALLGPRLARAGLHRSPRERYERALWLLLCIVVISIGWKLFGLFLLHVPESNWPFWFSLPAKLDTFGMGMLLALVVGAREGGVITTPRARTRFAPAGVAVLFGALVCRAAVPLPPGVYFGTLTSVGFALLAAGSVLGPRATTVIALRPRTRYFGASLPVATLGYSAYLWHEPVMLLLASHQLFPVPGTPHAFPLGLLILTPTVAVAAWLSYWLIEYPTGMWRRTRNLAGSLRNYYNDR